jgi:hypothetical protein
VPQWLLSCSWLGSGELPSGAFPVVVQHIELCTTPLVLSSQTPNVAKTIPLEDVDVVGGIVGSAVDGVTQIDSGRVPGSNVRDRLGDGDPCE